MRTLSKAMLTLAIALSLTAQLGEDYNIDSNIRIDKYQLINSSHSISAVTFISDIATDAFADQDSKCSLVNKTIGLPSATPINLMADSYQQSNSARSNNLIEIDLEEVKKSEVKKNKYKLASSTITREVIWNFPSTKLT